MYIRWTVLNDYQGFRVYLYQHSALSKKFSVFNSCKITLNRIYFSVYLQKVIILVWLVYFAYLTLTQDRVG